MTKSSQAFRTIREVAEWLGVAAHVLRFWESKFPQIKPVKRAGGRRYYRPSDMEFVGGIKVLLHDRGLTIRGVQRMIRENGISAVAALSPPLSLSEADRDDPANDWIEDAAREAIPMAADPVIHTPSADAPPSASCRRQRTRARGGQHAHAIGPPRRACGDTCDPCPRCAARLAHSPRGAACKDARSSARLTPCAPRGNR